MLPPSRAFISQVTLASTAVSLTGPWPPAQEEAAASLYRGCYLPWPLLAQPFPGPALPWLLLHELIAPGEASPWGPGWRSPGVFRAPTTPRPAQLTVRVGQASPSKSKPEKPLRETEAQRWGSNNPRASWQSVVGFDRNQGSRPPDSTLPGPSGHFASKRVFALFLRWSQCRCGWEGSFVGCRPPKVVCSTWSSDVGERPHAPWCLHPHEAPHRNCQIGSSFKLRSFIRLTLSKGKPRFRDNNNGSEVIEGSEKVLEAKSSPLAPFLWLWLSFPESRVEQDPTFRPTSLLGALDPPRCPLRA